MQHQGVSIKELLQCIETNSGLYSNIYQIETCKMSNELEWNKRIYYSLTELVLFVLTCLILFVTIAFSFIYSYIHIKRNVSFFSVLRPLFENIFPTAIAFTPASKNKTEDTGSGTRSHHATDVSLTTELQTDGKKGSNETTDGEGTDGRSKTEEEDTINLVVLGHEERSPDKKSHKTTLVRIWVHVYFIFLCGLIIVWAVSVFSDTVLYRKSSSCNDISVEDKDLSCFLLSNRDIPEGIQEIIDEEPGELVPCPRVHEYILNNSLTYDLEVICYQYQLNPLAALGLSYGTMKTISFVIVSVMNVLFAFFDKLFKRQPMRGSAGSNTGSNVQQPQRKISVCAIVTSQVTVVLLSLAIIAIIAIVVAILHEVAGLRDSNYDYLRSEKFHNYSVVILAPITILYVSFVPWWALEPLKEPEGWNINSSDSPEVATRKMYSMVHSILLHQKFSTPSFFNIINSNVGKVGFKLLEESVQEAKV